MVCYVISSTHEESAALQKEQAQWTNMKGAQGNAKDARQERLAWACHLMTGGNLVLQKEDSCVAVAGMAAKIRAPGQRAEHRSGTGGSTQQDAVFQCFVLPRRLE